MYSNCYTYQFIASYWHSILAESYLTSCFSTGKDELVLQFISPKKSEYQWVLRFVNGELFFRFYLPKITMGRKGIPQFKVLENQQLAEIKAFDHERALSLEFVHGQKLVITGFGRMADVVLVSDNELPVSFRNHSRKSGEKLMPQSIPVTAENIGNKNLSELTFLSTEMKAHLDSKGFNDVGNKWKLFSDLESEMHQQHFYADSSTDPPSLSRYSGNDKVLLPKGMDGLDEYAAQFIQRFAFLQEKESKQKRIEKDLKHFKRLLKDNTQRMEKIRTRRSYKELGDIVLSYAHTIHPGVSSAFLTDYYTGNQIEVKLNPDLNAAENAEKFYRKAKNENLELKHTEKNVAEAADKIEKLQMEWQIATESVSFRQLKPLIKEEKNDNPNKPYKEVAYLGFTIWIGKNAKSNDAMLKLAAKNDLWLHAREITGSHVIIKKQGAVFPENVVQFAAKLAAENSKAKSQKIVPVIAVERKYVTKGKNAAPGEVKVLKEVVVDAYLD